MHSAWSADIVKDVCKLAGPSQMRECLPLVGGVQHITMSQPLDIDCHRPIFGVLFV